MEVDVGDVVGASWTSIKHNYTAQYSIFRPVTDNISDPLWVYIIVKISVVAKERRTRRHINHGLCQRHLPICNGIDVTLMKPMIGFKQEHRYLMQGDSY
jgi:hypothetical protein